MHFNSTSNTIIASATPQQTQLPVQSHLVVVFLVWESGTLCTDSRAQKQAHTRPKPGAEPVRPGAEVRRERWASLHSPESYKVAEFLLRTNVSLYCSEIGFWVLGAPRA